MVVCLLLISWYFIEILTFPFHSPLFPPPTSGPHYSSQIHTCISSQNFEGQFYIFQYCFYPFRDREGLRCNILLKDSCKNVQMSLVTATYILCGDIWRKGRVHLWERNYCDTKNAFCPHSVYMCFVWIWEQTVIISLYSINWLVL
jgi:hypothetical protein